MPGTLFVVATPIGNLEDITFRALRVLREVAVIAAEDTRRTARLLQHYSISTQTTSLHEHNERARTPSLIARLERGESIALVSDAGTPGISDPGYRLVRACIDRDLDLEVLPGPSSVVTALIASGLPTHRFRFQGFLPRRTGELERVLQSTETLIAFESPRRLPESLRVLAQLAPDRPAAVCRELTKLHEEVARGTLGDLSRRFREEARGEIVVVIGPAAEHGTADIGFATDALRGLIRAGARPRAAASVVSALTGVPANDLYKGITGREPRR